MIKKEERICDECEGNEGEVKRLYDSSYSGGYIELCQEHGAECACCLEFKKVDDIEDGENAIKICERCSEEMFNCSECNELRHCDDMWSDSLGNAYCEYCFECEVKMCEICEENGKEFKSVFNKYYCESCIQHICVVCGCESDDSYNKVVEIKNKDSGEVGYYCGDCCATCVVCSELVSNFYYKGVNDVPICVKCMEELTG